MQDMILCRNTCKCGNHGNQHVMCSFYSDLSTRTSHKAELNLTPPLTTTTLSLASQTSNRKQFYKLNQSQYLCCGESTTPHHGSVETSPRSPFSSKAEISSLDGLWAQMYPTLRPNVSQSGKKNASARTTTIIDLSLCCSDPIKSESLSFYSSVPDKAVSS